MIRLDQLKRQLAQRLEKLDVDGAIEVLTYKRNRGFIIWKQAGGLYLIREHGYHSEVYEPVDEGGMEKLVARIAKREFPRSTQIRIYTHEPGEQLLITDHPDIRI